MNSPPKPTAKTKQNFQRLSSRKRQVAKRIIWTAREEDARAIHLLKHIYETKVLNRPIASSLVMRRALYGLIREIAPKTLTAEGVRCEADCIHVLRD